MGTIQTIPKNWFIVSIGGVFLWRFTVCFVYVHCTLILKGIITMPTSITIYVLVKIEIFKYLKYLWMITAKKNIQTFNVIRFLFEEFKKIFNISDESDTENYLKEHVMSPRNLLIEFIQYFYEDAINRLHT